MQAIPHTSKAVLTAGAVYLLVLIAAYIRIFFGLNFTDEAYYVALSSTFAEGRRPFIDELFFQQTGALVTVPLVKAYLGAFGHDGLVLFMRHGFYALSCSVSFLTVAILSRTLPLAPSLLTGAFLMTFVPANISNLSYNTQAYLGLLSGSLLVGRACASKRGLLIYSAGLALLALASFSFVPVTAGALVAVAASLVAHHRQKSPWGRPLSVITLLAGLGAIGALAILVVDPQRREALYTDIIFHFSIGVYAGGIAKLDKVARSVVPLLPFLAAASAGLVTLLSVRRLKPVVRFTAATALFSLAYLLARHSINGSPTSVPWAHFWGLAPLLALATPRRFSDDFNALVHSVWLPALVAGMVLSWAASGYFAAAVIGLLPGVIVGLMMPFGLRERAEPGNTFRVVALFSLLLLSQIVDLYRYTFRDSPISELGSRIEAGSFAGIRTSNARREFIEAIERDLREYELSHSTVLFLDYFPAGYLMTRLRPETPALWTLGPNNVAGGSLAYRSYYARYFDTHPLPDVVVQMKAVPAQDGVDTGIVYFPDRDPLLLRLFGAGHYTVGTERERYRIFIGGSAVNATRPESG